MLPVMAHACAETTGALWSSRTMRVRPLSSVVSVTPAGNEEISSVECGFIIAVAREKYSGTGFEQFNSLRSSGQRQPVARDFSQIDILFARRCPPR
jgi:hypothetical protein